MDRIERIREIDGLISSGDYDSALRLLSELEDEIRMEGGGPQLFSVLWRKGWVLYRKGEYEKALPSLMEADGSLPRTALPPALIRTRVFVLSTIGNVLHALKDFKRAAEYHTLALQTLEGARGYVPEDVYLLEMARTLNNRANAYVGVGEFERATGDYTEAMNILRAIDEPTPEVLHLLADINYNIGSLYYYLNAIAGACEMWKESLRIYSGLCKDFGEEIYCKNARKLENSVKRNCSG